jgi:excisionase family DNA binding protein
MFCRLDAAIPNATPAQRAALVIQLAARLAALGAGLASGETPTTKQVAGERNLNVKEAAKRLGLSSRYVYNHADELGGIRFGRRVVFPEKALARCQR